MRREGAGADLSGYASAGREEQVVQRGTMVTQRGQRQLPEARLNGNFAGGADASDPGLMQYSDVVTFFHEFGHMMHAVLGSAPGVCGVVVVQH